MIFQVLLNHIISAGICLNECHIMLWFRGFSRLFKLHEDIPCDSSITSRSASTNQIWTACPFALCSSIKTALRYWWKKRDIPKKGGRYLKYVFIQLRHETEHDIDIEIIYSLSLFNTKHFYSLNEMKTTAFFPVKLWSKFPTPDAKLLAVGENVTDVFRTL